MQINWERELNITDAINKGESVCQELNITVQYEHIGDTLHTEYAEFFDCEGAKLTSGVGKGGGLTSKVGAVFEGLEHYLTEYKMNNAEQKLFFLDEIPNIERCGKEKIVQLLYSDSDREKRIPCRKYSCLHNTNEKLWYPTFIINPFYADTPQYPGQEIDYSKLKRYSSNSGTAIGCSLNEAIIHATNEVIERDALSLFLLEYYYYRTGTTVKLIKKDTLPMSVQNFLKDAETELDQKIELINITTEFNVPVILAVLQHNVMSIPIYGAGASLYREYAVKRAISELIQSYHMVQGYPHAREQITENINCLKGFPDQYICAEFNTNTLLNAFEREYMDFNILLDFTSNNLNEYLDYLAGVLKHHNFDIYYSVGSQFSNGIHLVSVIIPNSERFFGVLFGQIVFPSDRGKMKNKLNNSIELPMLDYDIRVQQETKALDVFTNTRAQIKVKTCVSIHEEPYYTRENLFLIKLSEYTLCGRKLANHIDYEKKTINIDSLIRTNMILGHFHTFQMNDDLVYMFYSPCTEAELNHISKLFSHDKQTEVLFPFSPLDDNFQEYLVTFNDWDSLNSGQLAGLDDDEVHFRDATVQYLHTQETNNKVFYDPACSTGTFLGHLKQHFPLGKYIGSDQSNTMVALAKDKLDYAFQAEASQLTQDIQVDYLFLRFLNMEVVTIVQAYDLFEKLIQFLKPNGQLIIFGHTPVVINISYIADKYNLQICKRIGIYNEAIFQYYILQK